MAMNVQTAEGMPLSCSSFSEMARRKFQPSSLLSAAATTGPGSVRSTPLCRRSSPSTRSCFHSNQASSSHHIKKKNNAFENLPRFLLGWKHSCRWSRCREIMPALGIHKEVQAVHNLTIFIIKGRPIKLQIWDTVSILSMTFYLLFYSHLKDKLNEMEDSR